MDIKQVTLSLPDAARRQGVAYQALYKAVKSGALKAKKLGSRYLVRMDDLDDWYNALPDADEVALSDADMA